MTIMLGLGLKWAVRTISLLLLDELRTNKLRSHLRLVRFPWSAVGIL
jgi:hypothetical protein